MIVGECMVMVDQVYNHRVEYYNTMSCIYCIIIILLVLTFFLVNQTLFFFAYSHVFSMNIQHKSQNTFASLTTNQFIYISTITIPQDTTKTVSFKHNKLLTKTPERDEATTSICDGV